MFCTNCGEKLLDGATFCTNCGEKIIYNETSRSVPVTPVQGIDNIDTRATVQEKTQAESAPAIVSEPYNTYSSPAPNTQNPPRTNGLSIASMVLGIVSVCLAAAQLISLPSGILAIIFSAQTQKSGNKNGMAKAGMITGIIGLVLAVLWLVFCIACGHDIQTSGPAAWE